MSRFHNSGKGVWISPRPDTFPNGTSRRQFPTGRRDGGGFGRPPVDDSELDSRLPEGSRHDDVLNNKLDRLLDRFDKLDVWREDTDRKFENLEPTLVREMESPSRIDDGEDWEYEDARRRRSGDWGLRGRNPSGGFREGPQENIYSSWKIHPTTETGRERVNPPRSPYAYNAGHEPARQPSCWEPPPYQPDRHPYVSRQPWREPQLPSFADGPDPRRIHTEYQQWQLNYHPPGVLDTQSTDQPPQFDRTLSRRKAPLPAVAPPRSGSKHLPHQSREFIGSWQQCGRPNSPHLKVRSPCPVQLTAVSDYNEKLRIYRLEQATLLAELNAWFGENIDDANLVENVPNNAVHNEGVILDVDVPINESRGEIIKTDNMPLQVPVGVSDEKVGVQSEDEAMQGGLRDGGEILSMSNGDDSGASQVVATADVFSSKEIKMVFGEIGVSGVRTRGRSKGFKNEKVKNVHGGGFGSRKMGRPKGSKNKKKINVSRRNPASIAALRQKVHWRGRPKGFNVGDVPSTNHRSTSLDTDAGLIPPRDGKPCLSILGGVNRRFILVRNFVGHIRSPWLIFYGGDEGTRSAARCVFDPGGDSSPKLLFQLSSLFRGPHLEDKVNFNRGGVDTILYRIVQII